ncbi:class 1 fructose-bisphosphatase [Thermodesulfobacteriota bacterium]
MVPAERENIDLRRHLRENGINQKLRGLICEIAESTKYVINAVMTGDLGLAGTSNLYGEEQLALDILSDRIITEKLEKSGLVSCMASEEKDIVEEVDDAYKGDFSVAFDPLDGSSLIDVNLAVGSIFSIYKGHSVMVGGRKQIAAMFVVYGPRTSLIYSAGNGVHEFSLNHLGDFTLTRENIQMKDLGKLYSPGGLRSKYLPKHRAYIEHLEKIGHKLRYSGGLVPDINQILLKGEGIFMYPALVGAPNGKLRLLFELYPMAYLIEQAGGSASNGCIDLLDVKIEDIDQRAPIYIGCKNDVAKALDYLNGCE